MNLNMLTYLAGAVAALGIGLAKPQAATIAHWNFDSGTPGASMAGGGSGGVPAVPDLSGNNYTMWAWDDYWGPEYSQWGQTPTGAGLSSAHAGHDDGYCFDAGLVGWGPLTWTIELSVKLDNIGGWNTMIGRDGPTGVSGEVEAGFYFQNNGIDDHFRLNFSTVGGQRYILDSDFAAVTGQWYHLAAVSDGFQLTLYADKLDGAGFLPVGSLSLNPGNDNRLRATGNWTFGRGWWNGSFVDHIVGNLDNIRFSDVALTPAEFIQVPEPAVLGLLALGSLVLGAWRRLGVNA